MKFKKEAHFLEMQPNVYCDSVTDGNLTVTSGFIWGDEINWYHQNQACIPIGG